jgi:hypothetical protein
MDLKAINEIYDEIDIYRKKYDELIHVNRDEAIKYRNKVIECQQKADELLGISPRTE